MRQTHITRDLQITLYIWNACIQRAIDDYWRAPNRCCHDNHGHGCDELAADGNHCPLHRAALDRHNQRRRDKRKARP